MDSLLTVHLLRRAVMDGLFTVNLLKRALVFNLSQNTYLGKL